MNRDDAAERQPQGKGSLRGMAFMLVSGLCATGMNATVRYAAAQVHSFEIAFFRNFFGAIMLAPIFIRHGTKLLRTRHIGLHVLRGTLQSGQTLTFYVGVTLSPLAKVTAVNFTAPLIATVLAWFVLGETFRARRIAALAFGFAGTMVVIRPGFADFDLGAVLVLCSASLWAVNMMISKVLARTDSSITITLYTSLVALPITLIAALPVWQTPTPEQFLWLAAVAAFATIRHITFVQAFREADVTAVLPFDFTKLIWASAIGYVMFFETPDVWTWVGGIMIFAAVTYIAYREQQVQNQIPRSGDKDP
ncbi:MAG: DMT family transporter [Rhodospirillales bacterium]|nr:DMT family transporter [Rhodospirillales bacterium]